MLSRWACAALAVLLVACGGRAHDGSVRQAAGAAGDASSGAGAGLSGMTSGGSPGTGGSLDAAGSSSGPILNDFDNEHSDEPGRPEPPVPSAFFWGTGNGYHIGYWFLTTAEGTRDAGVAAIEPPRDHSLEARRASGLGLESGAVLWAQLDHPLGRAMDLRDYSGITFWARLEGSDGVLTVSLNDGIAGSGSLADREQLSSAVLAVGTEWQQVTLSFDDLDPVDLSKVVSIEFWVGKGGESFDLWLDDLTLLCPPPCH